MSLREFLVPLRGDGRGECVLDHAIALARRFRAHIDVVHCRPAPKDMFNYDIRTTAAQRKRMLASANGAADVDETLLRGLFHEYCMAHDLLVCEKRPWPADRPTAHWREETGVISDVLGRLGRVYDLSVIARPDAKRRRGFRTMRAAMLETGRPALLCPTGNPVGDFGLHPAIAWNGSAETARTVLAAMPLLRTAGKVVILTAATGDTLSGPPPEMLADHLRAHGLEVEVDVLHTDSRHVADALLEAVDARGTDCLITGAYGHSNKLEFIMGSVTQQLIERSSIPLFMMN